MLSLRKSDNVALLRTVGLSTSFDSSSLSFFSSFFSSPLASAESPASWALLSPSIKADSFLTTTSSSSSGWFSPACISITVSFSPSSTVTEASNFLSSPSASTFCCTSDDTFSLESTFFLPFLLSEISPSSSSPLDSTDSLRFFPLPFFFAFFAGRIADSSPVTLSNGFCSSASSFSEATLSLILTESH